MIIKLDIEGIYHILALPIHVPTYFGSPLVPQEEQNVWLQLKPVPMELSHSLIVSQLTCGEIC